MKIIFEIIFITLLLVVLSRSIAALLITYDNHSHTVNYTSKRVTIDFINVNKVSTYNFINYNNMCSITSKRFISTNTSLRIYEDNSSSICLNLSSNTCFDCIKL